MSINEKDKLELHEKFMTAVYYEDYGVMMDMLNNSNIDINFHFGDGWSIVERAEYYRNYTDVVDFLLKQGAVIDQSVPAKDESQQMIRNTLANKMFNLTPTAMN